MMIIKINVVINTTVLTHVWHRLFDIPTWPKIK